MVTGIRPLPPQEREKGREPNPNPLLKGEGVPSPNLKPSSGTYLFTL